MARRDELVGWIAQTRHLQRKLTYGFLAAVLPCIALMVWSTSVGTLALVCLAGTAIIAFWVTAAHIASHRQKLDELDRGAQRVGGGHSGGDDRAELRKHVPEVAERGGHRRWRAT